MRALARACREMGGRSPAAPPPVRIRKWASRTARSLAGQVRQELFALTGTETTDAALGGDPGALHDRSGAGLADARQRADDLGDLRLAGQVIIASQHIGEREGACFQVGQQGRPGGARLASLLQRFLALLRGQDRECHDGFLSVTPRRDGGISDVTPSWRATRTMRAAGGRASPSRACCEEASATSTSRTAASGPRRLWLPAYPPYNAAGRTSGFAAGCPAGGAHSPA